MKSRLSGALAAAGLAVALVPAVAFVAATPAAAITSEWSPVLNAGPSGDTYPSFDGVSCVSASSCVGVGDAEAGSSLAPIAGSLISQPSTWSSSALSFGGQAALTAVSCVSASWCMGVGYLTDSASATHLIAAVYNGSAWTPNAVLERPAYAYPGGAYLLGVSCTSPTFCVAVGYSVSSSSTYTPIVLEFNGTSWSTVTSISYGTMTQVTPAAVSCSDSTHCAVVGAYYSSGTEPMAVVLSGSTWTALDLNDGSGQPAYLSAVSCPAASQCEAGGWWEPSWAGDNSFSLVGSLDGTTWQADEWDAEPSQAYSGYAAVTGVSCVTPTSCVFSGYDWPGTTISGLVVTDSDGVWSIQQMVPSTADGALLLGVSCSSDSVCQVVGVGDMPDGSEQILTAQGSAPPSLSVPSAGTFKQGTPVNQTFTATGAGPLTISETGGSLPPGLTFQDQALSGNTDIATLSGTPGPYTGSYTIDLRVTDSGGLSSQYYYSFTVQPLGPNPPQVLGIRPNTVGATGGKVTITGLYFTNVIAVLVDGVPSPSFTVASSTKITATAPPYSGTGGHVSDPIGSGRTENLASNLGSPNAIEVVTAQGASSPSFTAQFTYSGPVLTGSFPLIGAENSLVSVTGQYLDGASQVTFDGISSPKFTVNSTGTQISAAVPYGIDSLNYISVTTPTGTNYLWGAFQLAAPAVTGVLPKSGPYGGGNTVTVNGTDMESVYEVDFGGVPSPNFTVNSNGTQITAVAPAGPAGYVPVTVVSPYGTSSTSGTSDLYQYSAPSIIRVAPSSAAVGSLITVFGVGLSNIQTVYFGSVAISGTYVYYDHNTYFVIQVPPDPGATTVDIRVVNAAGESAVTVHDQYTY